jgi:hypothetical protein
MSSNILKFIISRVSDGDVNSKESSTFISSTSSSSISTSFAADGKKEKKIKQLDMKSHNKNGKMVFFAGISRMTFL